MYPLGEWQDMRLRLYLGRQVERTENKVDQHCIYIVYIAWQRLITNEVAETATREKG